MGTVARFRTPDGQRIVGRKNYEQYMETYNAQQAFSTPQSVFVPGVGDVSVNGMQQPPSGPAARIGPVLRSDAMHQFYGPEQWRGLLPNGAQPPQTSQVPQPPPSYPSFQAQGPYGQLALQMAGRNQGIPLLNPDGNKGFRVPTDPRMRY